MKNTALRRPSILRAYVSCWLMRVRVGLQYRAAAWAGVFTQFFWGLMTLMIYRAFYAAAPQAMPMAFSEVVCYIWLQQALLAVLALWYRDGELFSLITTGNVAYELCRPVRLYPFWFARLLANRLAAVWLRVWPIVLVAVFLPAPYRLTLPPTPAHFACFLLSLSLGVLINIAISMLIYTLTFYTLSPAGSMLVLAVVGEFASGMLIPVPLMPVWLQNVLSFLPFRYGADYPLRVYTGGVALAETPMVLALQAAWLTLLCLFGAFAMRRALRRATIQGG